MPNVYFLSSGQATGAVVAVLLALLLTLAVACGGDPPDSGAGESTPRPEARDVSNMEGGGVAATRQPASVTGEPKPEPTSASLTGRAGSRFTTEPEDTAEPDSPTRQPAANLEFVSISTGTAHTCGVRTGSMVVCWGSDSRGQAIPPEGEFVSVSSGMTIPAG